LIADLAQDLGLQFPPFSEEGREALEEILPPYSPIANPLDAWGTGDLEATYPACVDVVANEPGIDLLAVSRDTPQGVAEREVEQSLAVARAAVEAADRSKKPVLMFSNLCAGFEPRVEEVLEDGGVPYLQGTPETLRAIQAILEHAAYQGQREWAEDRGCPPPPSLEAWRERLDEGPLSEIEARRLLADYDIPGPQERVASTSEEAVEAARAIGFPVVLKILSPDIQHKTDIGGVRAGLENESQVLAAFADVKEAALEHHPEADLQGVLVQEMVGPDAVEVIVGVLDDADFGPVVVFGSGGILVELFEDSSVRLPPVSRRQALAMIAETEAARLLSGFRGKPPADVDALVETLVRVSQLAVDLRGKLAALDINPLMVLPEGEGVRAVDALVEAAS
jgi:acyl-CoA synthetase (NDP forming)